MGGVGGNQTKVELRGLREMCATKRDTFKESLLKVRCCAGGTIQAQKAWCQAFKELMA